MGQASQGMQGEEDDPSATFSKSCQLPVASHRLPSSSFKAGLVQFLSPWSVCFGPDPSNALAGLACLQPPLNMNHTKVSFACHSGLMPLWLLIPHL